MMFCDHKKTKMKLVSWAIKVKNEHEQGFKMKLCCARCGCVIPETKNLVNMDIEDVINKSLKRVRDAE